VEATTLTLTPATAAAVLLRTHGITARRLTPLGSELASTFRAETADGTLAVKMQRSDAETAPTQRWRAEVAERLAVLGHPGPAAVRGLSGELVGIGRVEDADIAVLVSEWIDASPYSEIPPTTAAGTAFGAELGRTAARLQRDLGAMPAPPRPVDHAWAAHTAAETIERHLPLVGDREIREAGIAALALHHERIAPVASLLPVSLVHQDLHDDNVLVSPTRSGALGIAAVIDFDDMLVGWRVAEPAIAAAYLARRLPDPMPGLAAVASGWEAELPFTEAERTAFPAIAAIRLALNAVIWAARADGDRGAYAAARSRGSLNTCSAIIAEL